MKRLIFLPTAFVVFFLISGAPSILSADPKYIGQDNFCITELKLSENPWMKKLYEKRSSPWQSWDQHVSMVFVGEVVWAQPREEVELIDCGFSIGARNVRHRVTEVLLGDLKVGSEVKIRHNWCEFYGEIYPLGAKFIVGLVPHFYSNLSDLGDWGWKDSKIAWELPFNPENREIAKTFIQCIQDKGIVKALENENKY